jgi:DNA-binding transcriptional LysR family regulator
MDFKSMEYFVTVAEELNFTRAAERLHMSQPPLSSQIRQLEEDLGTELFIRGKRHLQLTPAGNLLLPRAQAILNLADTTRTELRALHGEVSGTLRIAIVEGRAPFIVAGWIAGFHKRYPGVKFRLWNGSSDDALLQMNKGLSDLAIIAAPYDREHLEGILAAREPWVAIFPAGDPLADREQVNLADLKNKPLIIPQRKSRIEAISRWFGEIGLSPNILCEMSSYIDAVALVEQGTGIGIFPKTMDTPNPLIRPRLIVNPAKFAEYYLVWYKNQSLRGIPLLFQAYVRELMLEKSRSDPAGSPEESDPALPKDACLL